ncbi:protein YgaD, partial [Vibrio parahaemolyticus V-223/04]
RFCYVQ